MDIPTYYPCTWATSRYCCRNDYGICMATAIRCRVYISAWMRPPVGDSDGIRISDGRQEDHHWQIMAWFVELGWIGITKLEHFVLHEWLPFSASISERLWPRKSAADADRPWFGRNRLTCPQFENPLPSSLFRCLGKQQMPPADAQVVQRPGLRSLTSLSRADRP